MIRQAFFITLLLPIASSLFAQQNKALQKELLGILDKDQKYREALTKNSDQGLWKLQLALDSSNLRRITFILDSAGFPGKTIVGSPANSAAFMVIQHADLRNQQKYLRVFVDAADAGEIERSTVVLMIDRIKLRQGKRQIYGTQMIPVRDKKTGFFTKKYIIAPLEDSVNVNRRRLAVGLGAIEAQAYENGITYP